MANRKGTLGSPYAVRDYRAINPAFGTAADFRALVQAVHARGMKLILDWVPNHTAWDNVWVPQHPDFYVRNDSGGLTVPRDDKGNLTDWTDVAQLDYQNPELRRAMIDAMRYWLVRIGIDGFRVDAAGFVPDDFWRRPCRAARSSVPRPILLLAEWGDVKMHRFGFDLTYAWDSYSRLKAVWTAHPRRTLRPGARGHGRRCRRAACACASRPTTMRPRGTIRRSPASPARRARARPTWPWRCCPAGRLIYDGQEVESSAEAAALRARPDRVESAQATAAEAFYRRDRRADAVPIRRRQPAISRRSTPAHRTT